MPSLSEIQVSMSRALLAGDAVARALPASWFVGDSAPGLKVHRNTVIGGCCQALRLSYPTLDRVLGEAVFDELAAAFARAHPPAAPVLGLYGEQFADFVFERSSPEDRPLLGELARFDWLFERVAQCAPDEFVADAALTLEGDVQLHLATSLRLFTACHAVDEWRIGTASVERFAIPQTLALWRRADGVAVQWLSSAAAGWLKLLVAGQAATLESALGAATSESIDVFANEIFRAGFARLTTNNDSPTGIPS
jgi:hypothetical protein